MLVTKFSANRETCKSVEGSRLQVTTEPLRQPRGRNRIVTLPFETNLKETNIYLEFSVHVFVVLF